MRTLKKQTSNNLMQADYDYIKCMCILITEYINNLHKWNITKAPLTSSKDFRCYIYYINIYFFSV